jgi:cholesterol oxidase
VAFDYDTIIVGSGFGGSVTAFRLAEAGRRVCLLERGKPYPPGSFPRSPEAMQRNFWDPSEGMYGLFSLWSFSGLGAIVSSGLGGGSLIYANVMLRKDERWFVHEESGAGGREFWPVTREDLEPHYDRAEAMLGANRYPVEHEPYASTPRTREFTDAAERLGMDWQLPPLAISFGNHGQVPQPGVLLDEGEHGNLHGRRRYACRLVGECDVGCNFGSKNSLDYNYLSRAVRHGLELRTLHEVRGVRPLDHGWAVDYVKHDLSREGRRQDSQDPAILPILTMTADRVVLAAGTFGSTYLLLRSAHSLRNVSPQLGRGFSGNGDLLGFALRATKRTDQGSIPRVMDGSRGPVITAAVRLADDADGVASVGRGAYIEDAGYPEFVNWMLEVVDAPGALLQWLPILRNIFARWIGPKPDTDMSAEVSRLLGSTALSSGLLPLLGMGRDMPDGVMHLVNDKLEIDWTVKSSQAYFERVRGEMRRIAGELGASFVDNPTWHLGRVMTVHPLGGCSMGRTPDEGVVDAWGRVFGSDGLYVADGAVMPGPVGANPSLTIAALADRFADGMLGELATT